MFMLQLSYTQHVQSPEEKTIQDPETRPQRGDTCRQRAEKQPIREDRRDPNMNSGGSAPADMGGEPPDGRARGQPVEVSKPPPEETLAPSVLAHVNDPA